MPVYHALTEEQILAAIEGYPDELAAAQKADDAFYRMKSTCKRCKSQMVRQFDTRHAFDPTSLLPRALLSCQKCGFLYDPHSDIILHSGSAAHIPQEYERHQVPDY